MKKTLTKILGDPQRKVVKRLEKRVKEVNDFGPKLAKLSDAQLKKKTAEFKARLEKKETLDDILPEAFAVVREASGRTIGMRHFDVQLVGAMALHDGNVAEMKTGEGKTLVATLAVYLNALTGKGVHVVTVNDYLAQRDAGWMAEIYDFLGLSVGVVIPEKTFIYDAKFNNSDHEDPRFKHLRPAETRREAYDADVTYGTNNEFGFDYLRDNMVRELSQLRQRELNFAIVDEVDSILVDEARTPLIISAAASNSGSSYSTFAQIARRLTPDDYEKDEKRRSVGLKDEGVEKVEKWLGVKNLYAPENVRMIYHMDQALRAETLFKRDKDYVVNEGGEVVIVDEFTGRLMPGRRYNEGLHQAIEAKEGVEVLQESMTLATISFQNYFRLYKKLSGMTGTAKTEEEEFQQIYDLDVIEIPTNMPIAREDRGDKIFKSEAGKFKAIVAQVKELQEKGQPVLIGTASIQKNEVLSELLSKSGVPHKVLNAKNNEGEAAIVAKAGQKGAVTLATNIAGRGTDIVLGKGITDLGGLYVLGSERHEARRIDNQLRGRAGRQGDPGVTQFFVSAEDDLMRIFGGERIASVMNRLGVGDDEPIENRTLSKALETAQKKVEDHNFDSRKHVVQYDDVMNRHRKATYTLRRQILESKDISEKVTQLIENQVQAFAPKPDEKIADLVNDANVVFHFDDTAKRSLKKANIENFSELLAKQVKRLRSAKTEEFGKDMMLQVEREIHLQILDNLWMQHLENMDHLREGINWRSVGQKDPLVEYRRDGQQLFEQMQAGLEIEVVRALFHAELRREVEPDEPIETELTRAARSSIEQSDTSQSGSSSKASESRSSASKAKPAGKHTDARKKKKQQRKNRKKNRN